MVNGARSQLRVHKQGRNKAKGSDQDLRARAWSRAMEVPCADPALSSLAGWKNKSFLPGISCSGTVVSGACTDLEVRRYLRGVVAD